MLARIIIITGVLGGILLGTTYDHFKPTQGSPQVQPWECVNPPPHSCWITDGRDIRETV